MHYTLVKKRHKEVYGHAVHLITCGQLHETRYHSILRVFRVLLSALHLYLTVFPPSIFMSSRMTDTANFEGKQLHTIAFLEFISPSKQAHAFLGMQ